MLENNLTSHINEKVALYLKAFARKSKLIHQNIYKIHLIESRYIQSYDVKLSFKLPRHSELCV